MASNYQEFVTTVKLNSEDAKNKLAQLRKETEQWIKERDQLINSGGRKILPLDKERKNKFSLCIVLAYPYLCSMKPTRVLLALGSNRRQLQNMLAVKSLLLTAIEEVSFTRVAWTEPIGIDSDIFANMLATGTTALSLPALLKRCKEIEATLGDGNGNHARGIVNIDIDVLQYGSQRGHAADWRRPYIKLLMAELPKDVSRPSSRHANSTK